MDLKEIEYESVDRINLAEDRSQKQTLVNTVMKRRVA
jgi:hypothetical protein